MKKLQCVHGHERLPLMLLLKFASTENQSLKTLGTDDAATVTTENIKEQIKKHSEMFWLLCGEHQM